MNKKVSMNRPICKLYIPLTPYKFYLRPPSDESIDDFRHDLYRMYNNFASRVPKMEKMKDKHRSWISCQARPWFKILAHPDHKLVEVDEPGENHLPEESLDEAVKKIKRSYINEQKRKAQNIKNWNEHKGKTMKHRATRKEENDEYQQKYREENTDKLNEKFVCDVCGGAYSYKNKAKHQKTKKHIKKVEELEGV